MDFKPYLQEIQIKEGSIESFEEYPFNVPAIKNMLLLKFHPDVTFIVGENGSGKSTFIESLAEWLGISRLGGSNQSRLRDKTEISLAPYLKGARSYRKPTDYFFLRAETLYDVASYLEEIHGGPGMLKNYGVSSLHECSHGESFLAILAHRLGGNGLYLFDEPEAALSPNRQLAALALIGDLVKKNSQFIIATHSPILLAYPNAEIYQFEEAGIKEVEYEQTEQFLTTRNFLNNYKSSAEKIINER